MSNLVQFPGLGISIELNRVAFSLFGVDVYWYGIIIGLGLALALLFAFRQANLFGLDSDKMVDVIIIGFITAIVFGRLYYVLFSGQSYPTFFSIIDLRSGGIAIYGAIIGAFLGALVGCKIRKLPFLPLCDVTGMSFLIGQSIGRWGNFFNQEAFGTNTTLPWGMISPSTTSYLQYNRFPLEAHGIVVDPALPVHPTFLYESLWCALGFLLLFLYRKKRRFNGELVLFYVIWYGLGRFFIEGLRTDPLMVGMVRVSQVLAAASVVIALVVWIIARRKMAGKPLVVPEIPPHTAVVKLDGPDGPTKVTISWPANTRSPSKEQRLEMARFVLATAPDAAEGDEKPDEEKTSKTPETQADELPGDEKTEDAAADDVVELEVVEVIEEIEVIEVIAPVAADELPPEDGATAEEDGPATDAAKQEDEHAGKAD
ncbi:MAG: prolipoprotein diacylglyceryl transferase [Oscillospiraceae bacterium]